jgi:uncharacterized protein DUF2721
MDPTSAIAVLTAMITPAVLISACGSMILSTSSRLGRVVDRVRALSDRLEDISWNSGGMKLSHERQALIFEQLDKLTSRADPATFDGRLLSGAGHVRGHKCGNRSSGDRRALHISAGNFRSGRRVLSFLWQYAVDIRSATGPEHNSRGDGFHLATDKTSSSRRHRGTTQTAFRSLSQT